MALTLWTGEERYAKRAEAVLKAFAGAMQQNVLAHAGLFAAELDVIAPALIVFVVPEGGDARALRRALNCVSLPGAVVQEIGAGEGASALPASSPAHGKTAIDGKPTAYVCIGQQCSLPVTEPAKLVETIKAARQVTIT
ncbi:MAG: thioredoxin domain-containing protein, partial [Methyloceanibacter sp.]